ncbi:MAG TPA: DUF1320 domain-containing protein [Candidatus Glassbacteria bacterium]|nr:DUF1320 domain-containing protein [Candidatus Glassbacteria bacterium]
MAAYTDIIRIKKYMPEDVIMQLTDDNNVGQICQEIVDEAIASAQTIIDAYLRGRYPVEMETADIPELITDLTTIITCYNLYRRKISLTMPDTIINEYKYCMQMLKDIQSGKITPFPSINEPEIVVSKTRDKDFSTTIWDKY